MLNYIFFHTPLYYLFQSLWRDEAFSYFMAKAGLVKIISNSINDFNPPLYYFLLHFWTLIANKSDEYLRFLSLFPHLASVYLAYEFASKIFSKRFAIFVGLFLMFNPMLVYYAFEMRMYSLYAFFALAVLYFFYFQNWKWYQIFSVLGLYTHSFFSLLIISLVGYLWSCGQLKKESLKNLFKPFIFYLPWVFILANQFIRSNNSWLFPADIKLVKSALGNLFTSFEGTPGFFWDYTALLSIMILVFLVMGFYRKRKLASLFIFPIFIPLTVILGYSLLRRPLYVNRYLIFITVAEVMGISLGIFGIKNKILQSFLASLWFVLILIINLYLVPYHKKTDFKSLFAEINHQAGKNDFVYTKTPIALLESIYYYKNPQKVFVYNPDNLLIPNYVGVTVVFFDISKNSLPYPPSRTYLVDDNANYQLIVNK